MDETRPIKARQTRNPRRVESGVLYGGYPGLRRRGRNG